MPEEVTVIVEQFAAEEVVQPFVGNEAEDAAPMVAEGLVDDPIAAPQRAISERLINASKRIKTIQERMAKAVAEMSAEVNSVRGLLPDTRLKRFLTSECAVDPAELRTYFRFTEVLGAYSSELIRARTSYSAIKTLVAATGEVRAQSLDAIALGHNLAAKDVSAIKRRIKRRDADPQAEHQRNRLSALRKSSERLVSFKLEAFKSKATAFGTELVAFYNLGLSGEEIWKETLLTKRDQIKKSAATLLKEFRAIFDCDTLPAPWLRDYHGTPADDVRLARAHDALRDLAAGVFQAWDDMYNIPFDTDHDYLDRRIVEAVLWLCDGAEMPEKAVPALARDGAVLVEPRERLTSLEICAGAGGEAIGLHAAGFDAIGIFEIKPDAVKTLKANYPLGPTHLANVRNVDFRKYRGRVDLVAGGVPCQPHSTLGLREGRDDERDLFLEGVRMVEEVEPRAFFFENVQGFGMVGNTTYRAELHDKFKQLGYDSKVFTFRGDAYGIAQGRPRVAFVGFRDGLLNRFRMPPVLTPEGERLTLGDAIYDLVSKNGWKGARAWADQANVVGPTIVGASDASGRLGFSSKFQAPAWERLGVDPVGIGNDSPMPGFSGKFKLTLEMGARLQGFPDDWAFQGSTTSRKRQIANALPPVMARAVGLAIYSALRGVRFDYAQALRRPLLGPMPGKLTRIGILQRANLEPEFEDA